jgi:hypothetical protein
MPLLIDTSTDNNPKPSGHLLPVYIIGHIPHHFSRYRQFPLRAGRSKRRLPYICGYSALKEWEAIQFLPAKWDRVDRRSPC